MGKYILILFFIFFLVIAPFHVFAHEFATDKNITAIMHIEPDDVISANNQQTIEILFIDKLKHFSLSDCLCSISIEQNKKTIYNSPLQVRNNNRGTFTFLFPKEGAYEIQLQGNEKNKSGSVSFHLTFHEQAIIKNDFSLSSSKILFEFPHNIHLLALILPNILFILYVLYDQIINHKKHR